MCSLFSVSVHVCVSGIHSLLFSGTMHLWGFFTTLNSGTACMLWTCHEAAACSWKGTGMLTPVWIHNNETSYQVSTSGGTQTLPQIMGKPCNCINFVKSHNLYYKSCENPCHILQVTRTASERVMKSKVHMIQSLSPQYQVMQEKISLVCCHL